MEAYYTKEYKNKKILRGRVKFPIGGIVRKRRDAWFGDSYKRDLVS